MFFRRTLIDPIGNIRQFHAVGFIAFYVVFVLICMNMLTVVRPLALGYDAMTLYLKLSALIHDYHGLVQGNLPYNWSLFISLGYLLFNSLPIAMTLCFSAYVLCLLALYRISRKWMVPSGSLPQFLGIFYVCDKLHNVTLLNIPYVLQWWCGVVL